MSKSKSYGAAIPPPSSINDEHLRKVDVEKSVIYEETKETPILSEYEKKLQALREKCVCISIQFPSTWKYIFTLFLKK